MPPDIQFVPPGPADPDAASGEVIVFEGDVATLLQALSALDPARVTALETTVVSLAATVSTNATTMGLLVDDVDNLEVTVGEHTAKIADAEDRLDALESAGTGDPQHEARIGALETEQAAQGARLDATETATQQNADDIDAVEAQLLADVTRIDGNIDSIEQSVLGVLDGDIAYQMDVNGLTAEQAYRNAWASGAALIRFTPNADGSLRRYIFDGLTTISGQPGREVQIQRGAQVEPLLYGGTRGAAEWADPTTTQVKAVLGFLNVPGIRVGGGGTIVARNTINHVPLAGKNRVDVTVTGGDQAVSITFRARDNTNPQTLTTPAQGTIEQTLAQFVADHNATTTAAYGFELSVPAPAANVLYVTETFEQLSNHGQGVTNVALSSTSGSVTALPYKTGLRAPSYDHGGGTFYRSHHGIVFRDCPGGVVDDIEIQEAWFGLYLDISDGVTVRNLRHTQPPGGDLNYGPARETAPASGVYIGDTQNAAVALNDCNDCTLDGIYARGTSEVVDANPEEVNLVLSNIHGVEVFERCIELSGARYTRAFNVSGTNCRVVLGITPYTGATADLSVFGATARYTDDAPAYIKALPGVVPFEIHGPAQLYDCQCILESGVDWVDMAAQFLTKNQSTVAPWRGTCSMTIVGEAGAQFRGLATSQRTSVYGHWDEVIYQRGGRLNLSSHFDVAAGQIVVVNEAGITDVGDASNASGVVRGTLVKVTSAIAPARVSVPTLADLDFLAPIEQAIGGMPDPLLPGVLDDGVPTRRRDITLALYSDLMGMYATGEQTTAGVPMAGWKARSSQGLMGGQTSGGVLPEYSGSGGVPKGIQCDGLAGFRVTTTAFKVDDWAAVRFTFRFRKTAAIASGKRRVFGFGGTKPLKVQIADAGIEVACSDSDYNLAYLGEGGEGILLNEWYICQLVFWNVGGDYFSKLTVEKESNGHTTSTDNTGAPASAVLPAGSAGVLSFGTTDGGGDAEGGVTISDWLCSEGADSDNPANMADDVAFIKNREVTIITAPELA